MNDDIDVQQRTLTTDLNTFFNTTQLSAVAPPIESNEENALADISDFDHIGDAEKATFWDPFFVDYFPEANKIWENIAYDSVSQREFSVKDTYIQSYDSYLQSFNTYIEDIKISNNSAYIQFKEATAEDKVSTWKSFLANKTDLLIRHKTVYIWILIDLLEMVSNMATTLYNKSAGSGNFQRAQAQIVQEMQDITFEKQHYQTFPMALIPDSGPIEHNAAASQRLQILRAYESNIQAKAQDHEGLLSGAQGKYHDQNNTIETLLTQLEGVLEDLINK